ncbi:MAG: filamentous hemagglutinin N-terminal domain-containing protein, partial [Magnetococcales bacterium]|nr:filamentous hemagglutinin N-terminal domain-containing protein [Magnetococcales bacterium]
MIPRRKRLSLLRLCSLLLAASIPLARAASSNITYDGSLQALGGAAAGDLAKVGGVFTIPQQAGVTAGQNLFHSFGKFNLYWNETANFTGSSVANVISRVTGGSYSAIDGTIRSSIPGANLYLINPSGVLFGPTSHLDISGSFYLSTADYLKLGASDRFYSNTSATSSFVAADPTAFGFLGTTPGLIASLGSGSSYYQYYYGRYGLKVPDGKTLSLVGGDIYVTIDDYYNESQLQAIGGRIDLASVAGPGEVTFSASALQLGPGQAGGAITVDGGSIVRVSGSSGGRLLIRGGSLLTMDSAMLMASTTGAGTAGSIDIQVQGDLILTNGGRITANTLASGAGGNISIQAGNIILDNGTQVTTDTSGNGQAGDIAITAAGVVVISGYDVYGNSSGIFTSTSAGSTGQGGSITLQASDVVLLWGKIGTSAWGDGAGGGITVQANTLAMDDAFIYAFSHGDGAGGDIVLTVLDPSLTSLSLTNGAQVTTGTSGSGQAGNIAITAAGAVTISGYDYYYKLQSGIMTSTSTGSTGPGGSVTIQASEIALSDLGKIDTSTHGSGAGGGIALTVTDLSLTSKGRILSNTYGSGQAGNIAITAAGAVTISG